MGPPHQIARIAEREGNHRWPSFQSCGEGFLVEVGDEKVNRKGTTRAFSDQRDLFTQFGWRPTGGTEAAEASCIGDGGNQCVGGVDDAHARLDDRMLDPEQLAESRPHRAPPESYVRPPNELDHSCKNPHSAGGLKTLLKQFRLIIKIPSNVYK